MIQGNPVTPPDDSAANLDPTLGGPKIEGPWLWVLLPDKHLDSTTDLLAKVSGGTITEQHIATHRGITGGHRWRLCVDSLENFTKCGKQHKRNDKCYRLERRTHVSFTALSP